MTPQEIILTGIRSFIGDPPDTDFQAGYLSSLVNLAQSLNIVDPAVSQAQAMLLAPPETSH